MRRAIGLTGFALTMVLAGCSKKETPEPPAAAQEPTGTPRPAAAVPAGPTFALSGVVRFDGPAPERKPIRMSADPNCAKMHPSTVLSEDIIVTDGKLQNAFVYVKTGFEGRTFPVPTTPAVLDQKGCMYSPRVSGVMTQQKIRILNSDSTLHNVHALPKKGEFNVGMPRAGMEIERAFAEPEVMVHFKCDVHPWMSAWVGVLPHPFFAVSAADGSWSIGSLPAGTYTIEAWHEKLGASTQTITVGEGATLSVDFTFQPAAGS